jgi:hypothetical protein
MNTTGTLSGKAASTSSTSAPAQVGSSTKWFAVS